MDRTQAIQRLRRAIDEYLIQGLETTLEFGRYVLDHDAFISGQFDTAFVDDHFDANRFESYLKNRKSKAQWTAASAALENQTQSEGKRKSITNTDQASLWKHRFAD